MEPILVTDLVDDPDRAFAVLRKELEWERRDDAPRCEYYCNDVGEPYTYGRGAGRRTYLPRPYHHEILHIRALLENRLHTDFEVCFLNLYLGPRDHLGWHSDDSPEMDDDKPVVSVSLGAVRDIQIRPRALPDDPEEAQRLIRTYRLGHGSAFVMPPGFQDLYQHRIPKASASCGERISLTFRGYSKPRPAST